MKALRVVMMAIVMMATVGLFAAGWSVAEDSLAGNGGGGKFRGPGAMIDRHDANGDGVVSAQEFPGPKDRFAEIDTNGDGVISRAEVEAFQPPRDGRRGERGEGDERGRWGHGRGPGGFGGPDAGRMIERHDANGDGKVSLEEFQGRNKERFAEMDVNGDGYITEDEVRSEMGTMRGRWQGRGERGPGAMIERHDANEDGKVSAEEFPGPAERFSELDKDGDGFITQDEADQGPIRGGGEGRERGYGYMRR